MFSEIASEMVCSDVRVTLIWRYFQTIRIFIDQCWNLFLDHRAVCEAKEQASHGPNMNRHPDRKKGFKSRFACRQLCLGLDQQMALCRHRMESMRCLQGVSMWSWSGWRATFQHQNCATTWRETSRATPQSVPACICHLQEHATLNAELFMPALTLEPGSCFHWHTDGWGSRGRGKIAATYPNTITTLREIDATDVELLLSRER